MVIDRPHTCLHQQHFKGVGRVSLKVFGGCHGGNARVFSTSSVTQAHHHPHCLLMYPPLTRPSPHTPTRLHPVTAYVS